MTECVYTKDRTQSISSIRATAPLKISSIFCATWQNGQSFLQLCPHWQPPCPKTCHDRNVMTLRCCPARLAPDSLQSALTLSQTDITHVHCFGTFGQSKHDEPGSKSWYLWTLSRSDWILALFSGKKQCLLVVCGLIFFSCAICGPMLPKGSTTKTEQGCCSIVGHIGPTGLLIAFPLHLSCVLLHAKSYCAERHQSLGTSVGRWDRWSVPTCVLCWIRLDSSLSDPENIKIWGLRHWGVQGRDWEISASFQYWQEQPWHFAARQVLLHVATWHVYFTFCKDRL